MVVLDSNHERSHVKWELYLYSPLVTKGQFLVAEDIYTRGRNVLFGPGQAVEWFLKRDKNFVRTKYDRQYFSAITRDSWLQKV